MENKTKIISFKNKRATNPNCESLTVEKLKTFKGMENINDEEAQQIVLELKMLSAVMVDLLKSSESENSENNLNLNEAA